MIELKPDDRGFKAPGQREVLNLSDTTDTIF